MKYFKLVVLTLSALVAGHTQAQSSVTLYGILDAGVAYVHNAASSTGGNQSTLIRFSSAMSQNRWGLRGTEDLGGGLRALFQLENGFDIGAGTFKQNGREFGRKAFMGLGSDRWGTLTLGRQYDPVVDSVQPLTGDVYFSGTFATPGDIDNYDNSVRINNSIKYASPNFSGLVLEALYGLGGAAGSTGEGQTYSIGANYTNGHLGLGAGYFYANGGRTATNGIRTWTSSSDSSFTTVISQGFASASSVKIARAGGKYEFGSLTAGVSYSNVRYGHDVLSVFNQDQVFNVGSLLLAYKLTPAARVGLGYGYTRSSGVTSAKYNQFNLGYDYLLSKATELYALAAWQKATGSSLSTSGKVIKAAASIGSYGVNSGTNSQGLVAVGIRHRF